MLTGLFFFSPKHYDFYFFSYPYDNCLPLLESTDKRNPCFIPGIKGKGFKYFTMKYDICYRLLVIFTALMEALLFLVNMFFSKKKSGHVIPFLEVFTVLSTVYSFPVDSICSLFSTFQPRLPSVS